MINQVSPADALAAWDTAFANERHQVPFLYHLWHTNWRNLFGSDGIPRIFSINNEIIGSFLQQGDELRFGGGEEFADYLDIIGPSEKKADAWKAMLTHLPSLGIKRISLRNVPQDSPTVSFFQSLPAAHIEMEDTTPILSLPESWETYTESLPRKYRHELERKIRKFEREHARCTTEESKNPGDDIHILLSLMEKDDDKRVFLTDDMRKFFILTAKTFAKNISLLITTIDEKPAAATVSFVDAHAVYLYNSGFDKTCCANAGFYTKAMTIRRAIETNRRTYNFLQGNERYKYELGGIDFHVYHIKATL